MPGLTVDRMVLLRAIQLAHPVLAASHRTAAWLHEIELPWNTQAVESDLEFTTIATTTTTTTTTAATTTTATPAPAANTSGALTQARIHRMWLPAEATANISGFRVTTVNRTLTDLLRSGTREEALVAVESAVSIRPLRIDPTVKRPALTHLGHIAAALESGPRRGARNGRAWLTLADRRSGSPDETVARLRIHDADLHPETQAEVRPPGGRRRSIDFLFREEGVAVEIEGYAYHGDRAAHHRDVRRFNELTMCKLIRRSLRFTAKDVYCRPDAMIEEIRRALALAGGG